MKYICPGGIVFGTHRLYPDRPQARAARALEELGLTVAAQRRRIADERAAAQRSQQPRTVMQTGG
jgi:hypothetical protein